MLGLLQTPQPPPTESILTALLNDVTTTSEGVTLVLDDYHVIDSGPIDAALAFLLNHLPSSIRLVLSTREDPYGVRSLVKESAASVQVPLSST